MKVIFNSLPKSGTHVLTRIGDLIGLKENNIHFSGSLLRRTHKNPITNFLKYLKLEKCSKGIKVDLDIAHCMKISEFEKLLKNFPENTYSQAHLPYDEKTVSLIEKYNIKMIYIIRDPRDVIISHLHHILKDAKYNGHNLMNSLNSYRERILASLYGFNEGTQFYSAPLRFRLDRSIPWYLTKHNNILAIKFEEIIGEKGGGDAKLQENTLGKIEKFLKLNEKKLIYMKDKIFYKKAETFRKGRIKDWQNYIDEELNEIIKKEVGIYISKLDY